MSLVIVTQGKVISKWSNESNGKTYYNLKIGDVKECESQTIGVPADVFNAVKEGQDVKLKGSCGGLNPKWWSFRELLK